METLRHSTQRERAQLSCQLAQTEEEVRHLKDKVFVLEQRVALESNDQVTVDERIADLMRERALLEAWRHKLGDLAGRLVKKVWKEDESRKKVKN